MSTDLTISEGLDIRVLAESGQGTWFGTATQDLGLSGEVDPAVIKHLYQEGIGPGGERLLRPRVPKPVQEPEAAAVAGYMAEHPFAPAIELAELRVGERAKEVRQVPYYDMTISAAKSVSVLYASLKIAAKRARARGDKETADAREADADGIEADLVDSARLAVEQLEREACYIRTGHHSAVTGEWRDGKGLIAVLFTRHISGDGDPQLHVHVAIANLVQRADQADGKWYPLYWEQLYAVKLSVAAAADRAMESRLIKRGYAMVPRPDGTGAEVGGVSQGVMDLFSSQVCHNAGACAAVRGKIPLIVRDQADEREPMPWDVPEYAAEGRAIAERLGRNGHV